MKILYSAPAKVILSGEHAVVYGKPALVSAINLRLSFCLTNGVKSSKDCQDKAISNLAQTVKKYLTAEKMNFTDKKFAYQIESAIPIGRGLGSSAALSVAATAAFLRFYSGNRFEKEIVNNLAYQGEKYFHKNPSGVDVSASCFGGLIFYRKEFEFLKNISSLNFRIPKNIEDSLYLIDSGKPSENTAEMVDIVGKLYNRKPVLTGEILEDIEKVTKRLTVSLIKEDVNFFKKNIIDNQILLEILGVVSKQTKGLLELLSEYGVGKITGAGGKKTASGYLLFFADNNKRLEGFLKQKRLNYYKFRQNYTGLSAVI